MRERGRECKHLTLPRPATSYPSSPADHAYIANSPSLASPAEPLHRPTTSYPSHLADPSPMLHTPSSLASRTPRLPSMEYPALRTSSSCPLRSSLVTTGLSILLSFNHSIGLWVICCWPFFSFLSFGHWLKYQWFKLYVSICRNDIWCGKSCNPCVEKCIDYRVCRHIRNCSFRPSSSSVDHS